MMYVIISFVTFVFGVILGAFLMSSVIQIVLTDKKINEAILNPKKKAKKQQERGAILEPKKELNEIYDQFFSE